MSQPPFLKDTTLSLDGKAQVDRTCDDFEARWKAGKRPRLQDFLSGTGPERLVLLRELLRLELEYRRKAGETPSRDDYRALADDAGVLDELFGSGDPGLSLTRTYVPADRRENDWPAIAGYEILGELGRGGMGVVYRARQVRLAREVALKTVKTSVSDAGLRQRLENEAKAVARFDHPNLVRVFDSGETAGAPWFALELVEGGTLAQALRHQTWQPRRAAELVALLADAVEYAHQRGVVHRDLKPVNVLLASGGCEPPVDARANQTGGLHPPLAAIPKITDFGLAQLLEGEAGTRTEAGCYLGTPVYMAPEQASGLPGTSGRAIDVFGLGAILYELLAGQAPFAADSRDEVLDRARRGQVKPPRQLKPGVPAALERICLKALAREPERRHATAGELARELRRYLARRRRRLVGASVLVAVVVLVGLGWLLGGGARPPVEPAPAPLSGELIVTITSKDGARKRNLRVDQPGALPGRAGEGFHVEAKLSHPAYVYLVLLSSQGEAVPLYPWNADEIVQADLATAPPEQEMRDTVHSPLTETGEWTLDEHDGLETVLLLARKTPLPGNVNLARLIGPPPKVTLLNPLEWAVRGGDEGQSVDWLDLGKHRGIEKVARQRDDPLLKILERLREEFEVIRAVRFAHRGK